jgi:hypothetical protein
VLDAPWPQRACHVTRDLQHSHFSQLAMSAAATRLCADKLAVAARKMQGGAALLVLLVPVGAALQQLLQLLLVACEGG